LGISIDRILEKPLAGERLTPEEGLALLENPRLQVVGATAQRAARERLTQPYRTYAVAAHVYYTNVCSSGCRICAFHRPAGHRQGFVISTSQLQAAIKSSVDQGASHVTLSGGLHPDLKLGFYERLVAEVKETSGLHVRAFSPAEIVNIARVNRMKETDVLRRLKTAGMDSMGGDGADVLTHECRNAIGPRKCSPDAWIDVAIKAQALGLCTEATMMFGHLESKKDRILHLERIRRIQDGTGGFLAFVPHRFLPLNTGLPEIQSPGAFDYLQTLAVSRLYLDNVPHVRTSVYTCSPEMISLAMEFGADDAGCVRLLAQQMPEADPGAETGREHLIWAIRAAGYEPRERDAVFSVISKESSD